VPTVMIYGLRPERIRVDFHEVPDDRWGRGGVLASDRVAAPAQEGQ
jgi:phenylpyruvate tautomerase PptA (4-oxalocrotonate tautomerase family)